MEKSLIQSKNNCAPRLPKEEINKIVRELSDPNLLPLFQNIKEELKVLERKLNKKGKD